MIKTVVFDFDGVIVDSNHEKANAFYRLFENNSHVPRAVIEDVVRRNVGTRFDILRDIFVLSGAASENIDGLVQEHATRFDALVTARIAERGLVSGARDTLADLSSRFCLYMNSATPEDALHTTVENLGIREYFRALHGAPATKEENLRLILGREGVSGTEVVVVGDGDGDLRSARACGTHFIAIASGFHPWARDADFPVASGIHEVPVILEQLLRKSPY